MSIGERRRKTDGRAYDTPPPITCILKELNALLDKCIADEIFKSNQVSREPTGEEQRDLTFVVCTTTCNILSQNVGRSTG